MSIYICEICGYTYDEKVEEVIFNELFEDWKCPICAAPQSSFKQAETPTKEAVHPASEQRYRCDICGYVYDEQIEKIPFSACSDDYRCPLCSAVKACFKGPIKVEDTSDFHEEALHNYTCTICGYIYSKDRENQRFISLTEDWKCPVCNASKQSFQKSDTQEEAEQDLQVAKNYIRHEDRLESQMQLIHEMAITNKSRIEAMRTHSYVPNFDDILLLGAQLNRLPLPDKADVVTETIIGASAEKPMRLDNPIYVSHMSFGALSKEAKTALALGSCGARSAQCSGEGGILEEERQHAYKYIFEYVPNKYSVSDENLQQVDAIEIKIGQGSKPGMGGHLPGEKVTEEIAAVRDKPLGKDVISPSRFEEIKTKEDLKAMVSMLRTRSKGRPIGIKIAAGHIEEDLNWIRYANPDFITIDGRGGATGASPKYLKDNASVPTVYALARARAYMDEHHMTQELIITGGFRTSGDIIKALAMGAHAVAIASAAMMAIGCQQYRVCHSGHCPMGIATQDRELRKRFDIAKGAQRLTNYLNVTLAELKSFARISGHQNIHDLCIDDLCTTSDEIATYTNISHC